MLMKDFCSICKRLANEERMDVLRVVMCASEAGLTVNDIADGLHIGQSATSQYLKQLAEECGLVKAKREGRYVVYTVAPAIGVWREIIPAMIGYFRRECAGRTFVNGKRPAAPGFIRLLPALANVDRLKIVKFLRRTRNATKVEIMEATKLTEINVRRHLLVIAESGLVNLGETQMVLGKEKASYGSIEWLDPTDEIAQLFLGAI